MVQINSKICQGCKNFSNKGSNINSNYLTKKVNYYRLKLFHLSSNYYYNYSKR